MRRFHRRETMTGLEGYLRRLLDERARGRDKAIERPKLLGLCREWIGTQIDDRRMRRALERLCAEFRCPIVGDDGGGGYFWAESPDEFRLAIGQIAARIRSLAKKLTAFDIKAGRRLTLYADGMTQGGLFDQPRIGEPEGNASGQRSAVADGPVQPTGGGSTGEGAPARASAGVEALRQWNEKHASQLKAEG